MGLIMNLICMLIMLARVDCIPFNKIVCVVLVACTKACLLLHAQPTWLATRVTVSQILAEVNQPPTKLLLHAQGAWLNARAAVTGVTHVR
jgi:uncharacterized protein YecT (DUF1311 family)